MSTEEMLKEAINLWGMEDIVPVAFQLLLYLTFD